MPPQNTPVSNAICVANVPIGVFNNSRKAFAALNIDLTNCESITLFAKSWKVALSC